MARDRPERVLLRRVPASRAYHQERQPARPVAADRGGLALPARSPTPQNAGRSPRPCMARADPSAPPIPPSHRTWQTLDCRDRRRRPRARRLHVGRAHRPTTTRGTPPPPDRTLPISPAGSSGRCEAPEDPRSSYAIPTRDFSSRQLTTGHCPAVPTRASQSDSRRCHRTGRQTPATTPMTNNTTTNHKFSADP